MKYFTIFLALVSITAEAKRVGHYDVEVDVDSIQNSDLQQYLMGWNCNTNSRVRFMEQIPDHKGRMKEVQREYSSDYSMNSRTQHEMKIEKNLDRTGDRLDVDVSQTCSKDFPVVAYREVDCKTDRNGKTYGCRREPYETTKSKMIRMNWECNFVDKLPNRKGDFSRQVCEPKNRSVGDLNDSETRYVEAMNQKKIFVKAKLKNIEETYRESFCSGNDPNRVVINLSGGLGGHGGENDFVVKVKIEDSYDLEIPTKSGLIDDDIVVCGAGDEIKVEISGVEQDLFFDDEYIPKKTLFLSRSGADSQGSVPLSRKSYTGSTDRDHSILVRVKDISDRRARTDSYEERANEPNFGVQ
jgi:hypothetical protein